MEDAEVFEATLWAHERWTRAERYEVMKTLGELGFPCEAWEEAEEIALWLLGEENDYDRR